MTPMQKRQEAANLTYEKLHIREEKQRLVSRPCRYLPDTARQLPQKSIRKEIRLESEQTP
jgi:hypothetical protein